jgi:hypothetical protein
MNKEFKNWVLGNARKIINADHRGLTMLYITRRIIYDPSTFLPTYKYIAINKKFYNEVKDDPQNTLMYNDKRFSELGDGE